MPAHSPMSAGRLRGLGGIEDLISLCYGEEKHISSFKEDRVWRIWVISWAADCKKLEFMRSVSLVEILLQRPAWE